MGNCCSTPTSENSSLVATDPLLSNAIYSPQQAPAPETSQRTTPALSLQCSGVTLPRVPSQYSPPDRTCPRERRCGGGGPSGLTRSTSVDTPLQQGTSTLSSGLTSRSASEPFLDNVQRTKPSQSTPQPDQQIPFKAKGGNDSSKRQRSKSTLPSTICDDSRFRILVLGKRDSGKSSLINAVFKVDMSVAPANTSRDIVNAGFRPRDNHRLIVHEYSGLESRNMQSIKDFITNRSQPNLPSSEKLHAIWICASMSDAIDGIFEEGTKILGGLGVPVVVVFTKFDLVDSKGLSNIANGDSRSRKSARATTYTMSEGRFCAFERRNPGGLSSEIVSNPKFGHLIGNLIATTSQVIIAHSPHAPAPPKAQMAQVPISPVLLAWSMSQRASRDVIIDATIEHGGTKQSPTATEGYWRDLWASDVFSGHTLAKCVQVIHDDIVDIWNFPDKDRYLSSTAFRAEISQLVRDLSGCALSSRSKPNGKPGGAVATFSASWLNDQYQNSLEDVCLVMGYIVHLTVVLSSLFQSPMGISPEGVQSVIRDLVDSGRKTDIQNEICGFVRATPKPTYQGHDLILERIIDLIKQFCIGNGYI